MNIDIDYGFLYYTANVNVMDMYWRTFGGGFWYNLKEEDRKAARKRLKDEVWEDIYSEYPALMSVLLQEVTPAKASAAADA